MSDATYTIATSGRALNYCALHWVWYAPQTYCAHCVTAGLIGELRRQLDTLEARIADLEAQAMQDRRRIYPLEAMLQDIQRRHNDQVAATR